MDPKVEKAAEDQPAEHNEGGRLGGRARWIALIAAVVVVGVLIYLWRTAGQVSTDDAQIDARVSQMAARISGPWYEGISDASASGKIRSGGHARSRTAVTPFRSTATGSESSMCT